MTDKKMIRAPELAERLLRYMTGQGSPLLDVGEAWKAGEAVTQDDLELAIEELEDLLEGGVTAEEREEISDLRAELGKLHPDEWDTGPGAEIRRRRKALGWTQQDLAERSGVRVATISDLETGKASNPRKSTLRLIDAALGEGEGPRSVHGPPSPSGGNDQRVCRHCGAQLIHKVYLQRIGGTVVGTFAGWVCPNRDDDRHPDESDLIQDPKGPA